MNEEYKYYVMKITPVSESYENGRVEIFAHRFYIKQQSLL